MPEIQERVERLHAFLDKYRPALPKVPNDLDWCHLQEDVRALLRSFLQECCKITCPLCSQGIKLLDESHVIADKEAGCPTEAIRRHFAWLLGGE